MPLCLCRNLYHCLRTWGIGRRLRGTITQHDCLRPPRIPSSCPVIVARNRAPFSHVPKNLISPREIRGPHSSERTRKPVDAYGRRLRWTICDTPLVIRNRDPFSRVPKNLGENLRGARTMSKLPFAHRFAAAVGRDAIPSHERRHKRILRGIRGQQDR